MTAFPKSSVFIILYVLVISFILLGESKETKKTSILVHFTRRWFQLIRCKKFMVIGIDNFFNKTIISLTCLFLGNIHKGVDWKASFQGL